MKKLSTMILFGTANCLRNDWLCEFSLDFWKQLKAYILEKSSTFQKKIL